MAAGTDAAMLAWRRPNVAELNARARVAMAGAGRLSGPELAVGERRYRAGDRIVTLAPGANGELVTSESGVIQHVDAEARTMVAVMDDGRHHSFGPDDTGAEALAHGYSVTVHRSQGATVDVAHLYADGGGRELGYVAMSRARQCSTVYAVADDNATAVEDLVRDWSSERRQTWDIDSGTVATAPLDVEADHHAPAKLRAVLARARLAAERHALAAAVPDDPGPALRRAQRELHDLRQDKDDLEAGRGRWANTPVGETARGLIDAASRRRQAEQFAADAGMPWRMKRIWRRDANAWAERQATARAAWARVGQPVADRLDADINRCRRQADELAGDADRYRQWHASHPEAGHRLARLDHDIAALDRHLTPQPDRRLRPAVGHDRAAGIALPPPPPTPDRGRGLGL